jgi:streptogramin lyase
MKIAVAVLLSLPAISLAQQVAIGTYGLPVKAANGITTGPDGALWFTTGGASPSVGRITTAGAVTMYPIDCNCAPVGITTGPDGALWFASGVWVGRITTAGTITEYPTKNGIANGGIATGPDGALWFTENTSGFGIGRITTDGVLTEFPLSVRDGYPIWIAAGSDGALWFTEFSGNLIGRITTSGAVTYYTPPTANAYTWGIAAGPDGALWFTEWSSTANKIGRITTAGAITEYPIPTAGSGPTGITVGPDGALWFTESRSSKLGRITTAGAITEYPVPAAPNTLPGNDWEIAAGPDGELWFTNINGIGEAVFTDANVTADPPAGYYKSTVHFAGSGFAPDESVLVYTGGVGSAVLASATADSNGAFSVTALAPQSPYGPRIFLGVGQTSGNLGTASFSMSPRLILNPASATPGSSVSITGYGFGAAETVKLYWAGHPRLSLGSVSADEHGTFNGTAAFTAPVPLGAPAGKNVVFGKGDYTKAIGYGSFTVQ